MRYNALQLPHRSVNSRKSSNTRNGKRNVHSHHHRNLCNQQKRSHAEERTLRNNSRKSHGQQESQPRHTKPRQRKDSRAGIKRARRRRIPDKLRRVHACGRRGGDARKRPPDRLSRRNGNRHPDRKHTNESLLLIHHRRKLRGRRIRIRARNRHGLRTNGAHTFKSLGSPRSGKGPALRGRPCKGRPEEGGKRGIRKSQRCRTRQDNLGLPKGRKAKRDRESRDARKGSSDRLGLRNRHNGP